MKTVFSFIVVMMLSGSLAAQNLSEQKDMYYLKKSQDERTAGYITLACGAASLIPGVVMLSQTKPGWETVNWSKALGGTALTIIGTACITASIVLFIKSDNSRRKAKASMVTLQLNKPVPVYKGLQKAILPYSVGMSFALK